MVVRGTERTFFRLEKVLLAHRPTAPSLGEKKNKGFSAFPFVIKTEEALPVSMLFLQI